MTWTPEHGIFPVWAKWAIASPTRWPAGLAIPTPFHWSSARPRSRSALRWWRAAGAAGHTGDDYRMGEFFIARARRAWVGQTAVQLILNRFAGRWEITEYQRNPAP